MSHGGDIATSFTLMPEALPSSAQKVQAALAARGVQAQVLQMPESTHTAAEAARAIDCAVAQIAKSLVFRARQSGAPILVIPAVRIGSTSSA